MKKFSAQSCTQLCFLLQRKHKSDDRIVSKLASGQVAGVNKLTLAREEKSTTGTFKGSIHSLIA